MGYADDHSGDTFRFYNPETHKIILSRDVTWAEWHGSQEVPESLHMFAADLNVDVTNDQIGEDAPTHTGVRRTPRYSGSQGRCSRSREEETASSPGVEGNVRIQTCSTTVNFQEYTNNKRPLR